MARGQPDYGPSHRSIYGAGLDDLGEASVRLGSVVVFDRRGQVIDVDDFEGTVLRWAKTFAGDGAAVFDSTTPKSGAQSVKLTSGAGAGHLAQLVKAFTPLASRRLGLECVLANLPTGAYFILRIEYYDGTTRHLAGIRFDFNALKIAYQTGASSWTDIIDINDVVSGNFYFYPVKLVVDFETDKFVRLLWGGAQHDLTAFSIFTNALVFTPSVTFNLRIERGEISGGTIHIDDAIITQDEP